MRGPHDQATMLGLQLDFVRQVRLLQQTLGHTDAPRITKSNNPRSGDHVTTL